MELSEKLPSKARVRIMLTDEELQLPAIDDLCNKYYDWLKLSKESAGGRKTRAANRRVDTIFDEIMAFKLPPLKIEAVPMSPPRPFKYTTNQNNGHANNNNHNSTKTSTDGESDGSSVTSSGPSSGGRTLRPRCRTPSVNRKPDTTPSTPTHQSIRAHMKKQLDSNSTNVLSAAMNQENPTVSLTKIRQLLRADSAQKKRDEERERQEKIRLERKAKEEKAEAQKKKLMEERAQAAKINREQRTAQAAEVRKAREKAKIERKLREAIPATVKHPANGEVNQSQIDSQKNHTPVPMVKQVETTKQAKQSKQTATVPAPAPLVKVVEQPAEEQQPPKQQAKPRKLDETFQKPANQNDNIDISIHDETTDEQNKKANPVADWAKAPHLREAVIAQFSKLETELLKLAIDIFGGVKLPVDLAQIFASHKPVNTRYMARTSSAVWTPPHKPLKRASSDVFTPSDETKR